MGGTVSSFIHSFVNVPDLLANEIQSKNHSPHPQEIPWVAVKTTNGKGQAIAINVREAVEDAITKYLPGRDTFSSAAANAKLMPYTCHLFWTLAPANGNHLAWRLLRSYRLPIYFLE